MPIGRFLVLGAFCALSAASMNKKCSQCRLANYADAQVCLRCGAELSDPSEGPKPTKGPSRLVTRTIICIVVCVAIILAFYLSLLASAKSLSYDQKTEVRAAIAVLRDKGFDDEALLLETLVVFKSEDNWLNASVAKEDAYAATNFPFEIITVYPEFFTYPADATERAAILLHESKHLKGADEHDAYSFVWKNRIRLGWTKDKYEFSPVWRNVRKQTKENAPELFMCNLKDFGDCTE